MRSSTSPAALALLALPMAVSARPRCHSVYPVSSVPSHAVGYNGSSHAVGYNVSSHVMPSASGPASAYPAVSASASIHHSASASASRSASNSASASASNSASASASYLASASASYSASASASHSASASNSASASASASAATSYPVADMGPAFCLINDAVISAMHKAPEATAFCSGYLSIPVETTTVTATQTPADLTVTVPATITGEERITAVMTVTSSTSTDVTETVTVTVPSTTTVTSTTSTAVLTCLNSAYTASEPVGTVPAQLPPAADKRTVALATPTCLPTNWASAAVSRACSCLSVAPATATVTATQTLAPGTATETTTDVLTPTITATTTAVKTETSTHTETETVTEGTATVTAYAEATSLAASGLQYRRWEHGFDANQEAPGYSAAAFKGRSPLGTGVVRTPTFRGNGNTVTLPGPSGEVIAGAQAAVMMQGFFVARQTGTYTLWSGANDIDNWGYLWTGAAAVDWRDDNTAFKAIRTGSQGRYTGGITYLNLRAGDAVPIAWLWANGGGAAASYLGIRGPDGLTSIDGTDFFVRPCDNGVFP